MSIIAKQSTARIVTVGPVLDATGAAVTDGVVADFKISKNGGAPAALNGSATLTHRHTGHYSLSLTATDLDTVGSAEITIDDTVNSCGIKTITVIEEVVYDALFAASANTFTGAAGSSKLTGVVLADTVTTLTGHTPQTGDTYALANGAQGFAAIDTVVDAILVDTAEIGAAGAGLTNINLPNQTMDITGNITGNLSGSVGSVTGLTTTTIADALLSRNVSNVEATAGEHTLCTVVLAMLENSISGSTLTIKRTDGTTTHATKTLSTNAAAEPIVGIT